MIPSVSKVANKTFSTVVGASLSIIYDLFNQFPANAFKKTYGYRSNSFSNNQLPEPE